MKDRSNPAGFEGTAHPLPCRSNPIYPVPGHRDPVSSGPVVPPIGYPEPDTGRRLLPGNTDPTAAWPSGTFSMPRPAGPPEVQMTIPLPRGGASGKG